jgi:hypothetical protein
VTFTNVPPTSVDFISFQATTSQYNSYNKELCWKVATSTTLHQSTIQPLHSRLRLLQTTALPAKSHTSWTQVQTVELLGYLMCRIT